MKTFTAVGIGALLFSFPVLAQTPIDPLRLPQAETGSYIYNLGITYTPDGQQRTLFDELGNPFIATRFNQNLGFFLSGSYSFNQNISIAGGINSSLLIRNEKQEFRNFTQTQTQTDADFGAGLSLEYRLAARTVLDPRLSVGVSYPLGLNFQGSVSLLKDPVILLASLGYNKPLEGSGDSLTVGLGAGFVANENISFSGTASYTVPVGHTDLPITSISFRTGYNLDPAGQRELGLRTTLSVSGRETRVGVGFEFGGRGNIGSGASNITPSNNSTNSNGSNPNTPNTRPSPAPTQSPNESTSATPTDRGNIPERLATVSPNDTNSIAAAIQELYQLLRAKDAQISALQQQIATLEQRLEELRRQQSENQKADR